MPELKYLKDKKIVFRDEPFVMDVIYSMEKGNASIQLYDIFPDVQLKYEFYEYIANVIQTAEQRVDIWRRSSSRTVQYLFHLYSDPDYLEKVLSSKGSWRLYTTDGGFFYMAPEGEIESHRPSEDNAHEETIGPERLFGGAVGFLKKRVQIWRC